MTIETTTSPRSTTGPRPTAEHPVEVSPDAVFSAVVSEGLEQWRVVAVLGIRVLAERVAGGGERRSFTLRFVRHRLALAAIETGTATDTGTAIETGTATDTATAAPSAV